MDVQQSGQNNWNYRPGYQRTSRVSGPIQPMQRDGLFKRIFGRKL